MVVKDNRKTPITLQMIIFGVVLLSIGVMIFVFGVEAFLNSNLKRFMSLLSVVLILSILGIAIRLFVVFSSL